MDSILLFSVHICIFDVQPIVAILVNLSSVAGWQRLECGWAEADHENWARPGADHVNLAGTGADHEVR